MRGLRGICIAVMAAFWVACIPSPERLENVVPDAPRKAARELLEHARSGDLGAIEAMLHSKLSLEEARATLGPFVRQAATAASFDATFGSWRRLANADVAQDEITYEVKLGDDLYLFAMAFRAENGAERLAGFEFRKVDQSMIDANRFSLEGKDAFHYAFVAGAIASPLLCLFTLVTCWRRRPEWRWLWLLFILVCFPVLKLQWTSGEVVLDMLRFNVLGAGFYQQGPLQSIQVEIGIPIGAILFWILRPRPLSTLSGAAEPAIDVEPPDRA